MSRTLNPRVAVYTGVGWLAGGFAGGPCPGGGNAQTRGGTSLARAVDGLQTNTTARAPTAKSGMLHVFKLP